MMSTFPRLALLALLAALVGCAATAPSVDCGPGGIAHEDHCHCEEGYVVSKGRCSLAPATDAASPDAGDAGDAGVAADCAGGEVLVEGACLPQDADGCGPRGVLHGVHCHCEAGTYEAYGQPYCMTPRACSRPEDGHEPNDTPAAARAVTAGGAAVEGVVCPGNDDWFSIELAAGEAIEVQLVFRHADGDLDAYLWRRGADVSHSRPLAGSDSEDDDETFRFTAPAADTYWLLVYGHRGAEAGYRLSVR
jgi:hypothetical protein